MSADGGKREGGTGTEWRPGLMRRVLVPISFSFVAGARHPGGRFSAISGISPTSGEQGGSCRVALSRFGSFGKIVHNEPACPVRGSKR
jgi:hypothetical protein